jgi:hypothetical protein
MPEMRHINMYKCKHLYITAGQPHCSYDGGSVRLGDRGCNCSCDRVFMYVAADAIYCAIALAVRATGRALATVCSKIKKVHLMLFTAPLH